MGSVFLKMPEATSAYFSRGGVLFLCVFPCLPLEIFGLIVVLSQRPAVLCLGDHG